MYKKYIIFVIIVIMTLSLLWQVSGYSKAMIENLANISLTKSEDALIAVPKEIKFDLRVKETDFYDETLYYEEDRGDEDTAKSDANPVDTSREHRGTSYDLTIDSSNSNEIKNNMSKDIDVEVALENNNLIRFNQASTSLSPGEKAHISSSEKDNGEIVTEVIDTEESLYQNYSDTNEEIPIIILAEWEGGQAEIESSVILYISTEKETVTSTTEEVRPAPKEEDEENGDGEKSVDKNETKNGDESSDREEINGGGKEDEKENDKNDSESDTESKNNLEEGEDEEDKDDNDDNEEEEEKNE